MQPHYSNRKALWPMIPLGAICEVGAGNGAPQGDVFYSGGIHPFVRMQDVGRSQTPYIMSTVDRLNDLALDKHRLRKWPANSLLIPKSGASVALNKRALLNEPSYVVSHLAVVVPGALIDSEYLYYLSCTLDMMRLALDSSYPSLRTSDLAKLRIPLPPLSEQRRIVEILKEAEEIRRLRTEAETKTADFIISVFDKFFGDPVNNQKKWQIETISRLINGTPKNGLYKPVDLYGEGTPIIRIGDFSGGTLNRIEGFQRVRISNEEVEQFGVCNGQILINRVNSIEYLGKSLLIKHISEPTVYESNMMRLDVRKGKVRPEYLIACLQHPSVLNKVRAKAKRAIHQASINQTDVLTLAIAVPPIEIQDDFISQAACIEKISEYEELSARKERALISALSAFAFSGQLTEKWREHYNEMLALEVQDRDAYLKETGDSLHPSRRGTIQEMEEMLELPTDGIYSDLNNEQRLLLFDIRRMVGGVSYARYFSAEMVSNFLSIGGLRRNPQAIEGNLAVFASLGLVIPVSREEKTEDTGEIVFGNAYRLPRQERLERIVDGKGVAILIGEGKGVLGNREFGDYSRLKEMSRLSAILSKDPSRQ